MPKRKYRRNSLSNTRTATEVRSPTRTATSTDAYTAGNVTVTGGAGRGATSVHIHQRKLPESEIGSRRGKGMPIGNPENEIGEEWTPVHAIRKCANGDIQLLVEKGSLSNPGKKKSILGKLKKMFSVDTNFQGKEINRALGNPSGLSYKVAKIPGSKKYAIYRKSDKPSKTNWVTGPFNTSSEALQYYTSWDYPSYPSRSKNNKK